MTPIVVFLGRVIDAGHDVMGSSIMLIEEVKIIVTNPRSADSQRKLQNVAKVRDHTPGRLAGRYRVLARVRL